VAGASELLFHGNARLNQLCQEALPNGILGHGGGVGASDSSFYKTNSPPAFRPTGSFDTSERIKLAFCGAAAKQREAQQTSSNES
jgi:hypothetical protein